jgi:UDPglucose 6-dehydrogenase
MRVAYVNEIDTFADIHRLNVKEIIDGICLDPRIGQGYNNPSFGYGGYCLPKDTKQLKAIFNDVPNNLVSAIVDANAVRKTYIADSVIATGAETIGVYRLVMKANSDNFREASALDVINKLRENGKNVLIYEPQLSASEYSGCIVVNDFGRFTADCDLIVANRISEELTPFYYKVYTRDVYMED